MKKPDLRDNSRVMPEIRHANVHSMSVCEIVKDFDQNDRDEHDQMAKRKPGQFEWLGPFVLPPFQRPPVWTVEQNIRFIESMWLGYDIGRYCVVSWEPSTIWGDCLIDGQQRIRAILDYVNSRFPVMGHYYKDVTRVDRRVFEMIVFPRSVIRVDDIRGDEIKDVETRLREIYNRLNYGGTAHTEEQRA